jgi:glycosyltransferase involved in cell wall biosynthesis
VIGRVQPRKKQTDAVRVLRGLLDAGHTEYGLIIAGDCEPEYEPEMRAVIHETKLQDRVIMLGNFADIQTLFELNPICLLTSLREALPGSVMESLLAGRPCFMYPCEGAEDIFGPHQKLFVSDDFKPNQLVKKMTFLLADLDLLLSETEALQKRAQTLFSREAHLHAITEKLNLI